MTRARLFWILALLNVIWAPTNFMFKVAQREASPAALVLVRWWLFTAVLWIALAMPACRRLLNCTLPRGSDRVKALLIGVCCVALSYNLNSLSLTMTSTIEANLLSQSYPVVMGVLAFFFLGEHIGPRRWLAIGVGMVGAYGVAIGFEAPNLRGDHALGNLVCASGLMLECVSLVMATRIVLRSSGLGVLAFEALGAALGCCLYSLMFPATFPLQIASFGWATAAVMAYLVLIAGVFAFGAWYVLVEKAPVSLMMISTLIQPPVAALLGVLVLGETLAGHVYFGSAFILAAVVIGATERVRSSLAAGKVPDEQAH